MLGEGHLVKFQRAIGPRLPTLKHQLVVNLLTKYSACHRAGAEINNIRKLLGKLGDVHTCTNAAAVRPSWDTFNLFLFFIGQSTATILDITLETNAIQVEKLMHIQRTNFVTPSTPVLCCKTWRNNFWYFAMIPCQR